MTDLLIQYIDEFDRYLNGEMEASELAAFEQKMAAHTTLAKAYQEYRHMNNLLLQEQVENEVSAADKAEAELIQAQALEAGLLLDEDDIFDYTLGATAAQIVSRIERRSKQDADFAELVAKYQQIAAGIKAFSVHYNVILAARQTPGKEDYFDRVNEQVVATIKRERLKVRWINLGNRTLIAASFATLLTVFFLLTRYNQDPIQSSVNTQMQKTEDTHIAPINGSLIIPDSTAKNRVVETETTQLVMRNRTEPSPATHKPDRFSNDFAADLTIARQNVRQANAGQGIAPASNPSDSVWMLILHHHALTAVRMLTSPQQDLDAYQQEYALGIAFFSLEDYATAEQHFEKAAKAEEATSRISHHASWLQALCLYKRHAWATCREKLTLISNDPEHPYAQKATALLLDLK